MLSYAGANLSVTAAPLTVASNASSPVFPSYFTPTDLVGNHDNEDRPILLDCRRAEPFGTSRLDKACKDSKRRMQKWPGAAVMTSIAAKRQP